MYTFTYLLQFFWREVKNTSAELKLADQFILRHRPFPLTLPDVAYLYTADEHPERKGPTSPTQLIHKSDEGGHYLRYVCDQSVPFAIFSPDRN